MNRWIGLVVGILISMVFSAFFSPDGDCGFVSSMAVCWREMDKEKKTALRNVLVIFVL